MLIHQFSESKGKDWLWWSNIIGLMIKFMLYIFSGSDGTLDKDVFIWETYVYESIQIFHSPDICHYNSVKKREAKIF